ncbi:MAG: TetR-like C-terminal domain-containing protein, partial [Lacisediminihabitans sp.]
LYKQFESKADIETQLIEIGFRLQGDTTQRALAALGPSPSRKTVLEMLVHAYRDFGARHPQLYRLMHERPLPSSLPSDVYEARATTYRGLFAEHEMGVSLWTWAHGLLVLEIAGRYGPEVDIDRLWEILIEKATVELN